MRTETRFARMGMMHHVRVEYPNMDPNWKKWIVVQSKDNLMTLTTREVPGLSKIIVDEIEEEIGRRR